MIPQGSLMQMLSNPDFRVSGLHHLFDVVVTRLDSYDED